MIIRELNEDKKTASLQFHHKYPLYPNYNALMQKATQNLQLPPIDKWQISQLAKAEEINLRKVRGKNFAPAINKVFS